METQEVPGVAASDIAGECCIVAADVKDDCSVAAPETVDDAPDVKPEIAETPDTEEDSNELAAYAVETPELVTEQSQKKPKGESAFLSVGRKCGYEVGSAFSAIVYSILLPPPVIRWLPKTGSRENCNGSIKNTVSPRSQTVRCWPVCAE